MKTFDMTDSAERRKAMLGIRTGKLISSTPDHSFFQSSEIEKIKLLFGDATNYVLIDPGYALVLADQLTSYGLTVDDISNPCPFFRDNQADDFHFLYIRGSRVASEINKLLFGYS